MTNGRGAFSMRSSQAAGPEQITLPWTSMTSARPACTSAPQASSVAGVVSTHGVTLSCVATLVVRVGPEVAHAPSATVQAVKKTTHLPRRQVGGETIVLLQHCKGTILVVPPENSVAVAHT